MTPWARATLRVGGWTVLLASIGVLVATVVVPRLVGGYAYAVTSASMEPTIPTGSVVVVRPVQVEDIGVGSVITFQLESGKPGVGTHRVVTQGMRDGDQPLLHTRGDANEVGDRHWVRPEQVKGEVWYSVPYVGRLTNLLPGTAKLLAVLVLGFGSVCYAMTMFVLAIRDRRRVSHA